MKIKPLQNQPQERGSIMVLVVIVTGLIGFTLASYLTLVKSQNQATMRSQAWNATVPVIEAGIEDALAHLNEHADTGLATDGWTKSGNVYWIQRSIGDASYLVTITNYFGPGSSSPMVQSIGYVPMPVQVVSSRSTMFATVSGNGTANLGRGVRVNAARDALFAKGLVADGQIDLKGNRITSDSFDSTDPAYSTGGQYDPAKRKANGDIATNSELIDSLSVGNAEVYGKVSTGPGGSVSIGPTGAVGDLGWHSSGNTGIQPGWSSDDMNVDFPPVEPPFTGGAFSPAPGIVSSTFYDYVLPTGNYQMSALHLSSSQTMLVTGDAVLYVTTDIEISGLASIKIAPGGRLNLYMSGHTTEIGGNGIVNETGSSTNFIYRGLPSNHLLKFAGNGTFTGVIYAPDTDFELSGSGSSAIDFVGASITKTVTLNGKFNFHYDEALRKFGPSRGYIVTTWNELTPAEVASFNVYKTLQTYP